MVEVIDLPEEAQAQLWREVAAVSAAVRELPGVKKLNVAAIGERHVRSAASKEDLYHVASTQPRELMVCCSF